MKDEEGAANTIIGLNRIKKYAEDKGILVVMELLNSKVNHKDYMCDRTPWGVTVMKEVNSPMIKLLYDIYHMQIMEGDVIRTIRENHQWIGHYHTGGNPGPQRDRRHPGTLLPRHCAGHHRHRLHRIHGSRIHPPNANRWCPCARPLTFAGCNERFITGPNQLTACRLSNNPEITRIGLPAPLLP